MRLPKFRFHWEAIVWIAIGIFVGHRLWPQVAAATGVPTTDKPAPAFQLTTLDGKVITSDQLRGKVVLLNFWASWCPPCRFEMPGFESVYEQKKSQDFVVIGVSMDNISPAEVNRFLAENHITYPVAMANGDIVEAYGNVNLLPTSFLIDREGRIRNEVQGIFASVALDQAVNRLLAESGPVASRGDLGP